MKQRENHGTRWLHQIEKSIDVINSGSDVGGFLLNLE
jgi:hypothetical protein